MASQQVETVINSEKISTQLAALSLEDVITQHRRERKELQAKIQALKKNAPKKKRKEAMEEVTRLENELEERHKAELAAHEASAGTAITAPISNETFEEQNGEVLHDADDQLDTNQGTQQRVSKAQKRRDKKAREAREREEELRAELNATDEQKSPKIIELKQILGKLKERQLQLQHINSDGDCLYNAVRHQLLEQGLPAHSVDELRNETANYIEAHKDALICYMTNPETGDLLDDQQFDDYCNAVRSTAAWGGQIELKALSAVLKVPIEVLQAVGPPTILGDDEFSEPKLIITYHRHMYQLGEHYNSTRAQTTNDNGHDDA